MQACTSLQTDNHTSTPPLSFLQAGCPSCRPTNSIKALKEKHLQQATIKIAPSHHRGGDPGPHVTHGSLGPPESIRQMALKSVGHFYTAHSCDQQIHTHTCTPQTHTRIGSNKPQLMLCMEIIIIFMKNMCELDYKATGDTDNNPEKNINLITCGNKNVMQPNK